MPSNRFDPSRWFDQTGAFMRRLWQPVGQTTPSGIHPRITLHPGQSLAGRYRLHQRLGEGATAEVWSATDELLQVPVALKVIQLDHLFGQSDLPGLREILRHEARAILALSHPNIVRAWHYLPTTDHELLVMERVSGPDLGTLRAARPGNRLTEAEVVSVAREVLGALAEAHARGVIHNDLKPTNLLLDDERHLKVADFGLAALDGRGLHAPDLGVLGTPAYMAPERIRGEPGTPASDLYSLAATLFDLATGSPPFGRENRIAFDGHLHHPPPTSSLLSPAFDRILRKALQKMPADRWPDAAHFFAALSTLPSSPLAFAENQPSPDGIPTTDPPMPLWEDQEVLSLEGEDEPWALDPLTCTDIGLVESPAEAPAAPLLPPAAPVAAPTGMVTIPGATLNFRGVRLEITPFFLARTPVTVAQWADWLLHSGAPPPHYWPAGRPPPGTLDHPIVGITRQQASSYAQSRGWRLPTTAEWLVAAGQGVRAFPWGSACARRSGGPSPCNCPLDKPTGTSPVSAHPTGVSPDGVFDLIGNVWEWTEDHPGLPPDPEGRATVLGGSFKHRCGIENTGKMPTTAVAPDHSYLYLGFRCAHDLGGRP